MKELHAEIKTLINRIEPMRHKIISLDRIARQHDLIGETSEANECREESEDVAIKMAQAKKELDVLMPKFEAMQVAEWEAADAKKSADEAASKLADDEAASA